MTNYPLMGMARVIRPVFFNFGLPITSLELLSKDKHFKFRVLIDTKEC